MIDDSTLLDKATKRPVLLEGTIFTPRPTIEPRRAIACSHDLAFCAVLHAVQPAYAQRVGP